jgi:hypothetical protein
LLANPSFELNGTGGYVFAGWNQFGVVGSTSNASHGSQAARLTGPNIGDWAVSGVWQRFDTSPGEQWAASVVVWHTATNSLSGSAEAIVNIEWRDSGDNLISYESYTAADASTPVDEYVEFSVESGPAPPGTATTRLLIGVLQGPTDPVPVAYYDVIQFDNLGPPTIDDIQWNDFPTSRTIDFAGYSWRVKGPGYYGPGPNIFCSTETCTWADNDGRLHMTIQYTGGAWRSTEVTLVDPLGYGDYIFTTLGRLDTLHSKVVLGLFVWQYGACYDAGYLWWNPYNEFDVEVSRWGIPGKTDIGQFVAQPWDYPGNIDRFTPTFATDQLTSFAFRWLPDRVECRAWIGGPQDEEPGNMIHTWTYTGPHIPRPEQPRVHINLWHLDWPLDPPTTNQEVILDDFTFVPEGGVISVPEDPAVLELAPTLSFAQPNPFRGRTTIRFTMPRDGQAEIAIYDVAGRLVRSLLSGYAPAGPHDVVWDGRNDSGSRVASGVYLYQFRSGDRVETKRMVLLK